MKLFRTSLVKAAAVLLFSILPLNAQENQPSQEDAGKGQVVRLFLDCQGGNCRDMDFFRTEVQFVNWVRDRSDSDVHLLITSQATGAGGSSYELLFMGRERFEGMEDTLTYISGYDATQDEVRNGMTDIIKIGLMRFVGMTSVAGDIVIGMRKEESGTGPGRPGGPGGPGPMATAEDDPWNFWVFRTSLSGYGTGESTYKQASINGSITASRTTEEWKTSFRLSSGYNERRFDYGDVSTLNITRSHSLTGLQVKSLTGHWSAGLRGSVSSSTYSNFRLSAAVSPVLEYNFFPYSESTRRSLTVQYAVDARYFDYVEETVYFKTEEGLLAQSLGVSLDMNQPWGSSNLFASAGHFLRDIGQHNASIGGSVNLRLARGFGVNLGGSVSRIQDRISVPLESATVEDVLLRRKQLQTDYNYFLSFGVNYTFGSIFNNIVNPRIGGGGGGGMIIMM